MNRSCVNCWKSMMVHLNFLCWVSDSSLSHTHTDITPPSKRDIVNRKWTCTSAFLVIQTTHSASHCFSHSPFYTHLDVALNIHSHSHSWCTHRGQVFQFRTLWQGCSWDFWTLGGLSLYTGKQRPTWSTLAIRDEVWVCPWQTNNIHHFISWVLDMFYSHPSYLCQTSYVTLQNKHLPHQGKSTDHLQIHSN